MKNVIFSCAMLLSIVSCKKEYAGLTKAADELKEVKDSIIIPVKSDTLVQKFFILPDTIHGEIRKVAIDVKEQNSKYNFLSDFIKKNGLPVWEKTLSNIKIHSLETTSLQDTVSFFIPIKALKSNEITAFIACMKTNNSYNYRMYKKSFLSIVTPSTNFKPNLVDNAFGLFAFFEKEINNNDSIYINGRINKSFANTVVSFNNNNVSSFFAYHSMQICIRIGSGNHNNTFSVVIGQYLCTSFWVSEWTGGGTVLSAWWFDDGGGFGTSGGNTNYSETVLALQNILGVGSQESDFLQNNPEIANQILHYLQTTNRNLDEAKEISKEHIIKMLNSIEYHNFVLGHAQTTTSGIVWWEDDNWLNNPVNFNLDIDAPANQLDQLNVAEKLLVGVYPVQAYQIMKNVNTAKDFTASTMGASGGLNDKKDAFRHAFFQAINTRDVTPRIVPGYMPASNIVLQFANAHESEVPSALNLEKDMDLFNNSVGINYCLNCWTTSNSSIASAILTKLNNGDLRYIKPLDFVASPTYDANRDGIQDCSTCLNGILHSSVLKPTNQ